MKAEVKVCGITYSVIVQEHFKAYDDERNLWGYCDYEQQIIYVRESLSEERKRQVLIHELTHAMLQEAGYKEQDEDLVTRFSIILHQVLIDNPKLFNV
ncbi:TPA: ImmA/IrrE family metallo-endopeptidase [Streptococcus suis]|nr:ImmA/IrrE family metallo-endopeptidase [Streptococcus suis]HEL2080428.1 ImmA/IrrE family metallo-endopeptidase [Streptococcus suis]HEL2467348.1 ImmA/IrrE family metallo-endopeptidase [Streptococcus suis]